MEYTDKELSLLIYNLRVRNPNLTYRYICQNSNELKFIFRDENFNLYEIDDKNKILKL